MAFPRIISLRVLLYLAGVMLFPALRAYGAIDGVPAPTDRIFDDTRAFSDETRRDIVEEIQSLRADLKADIWLTATSFTASGVTIRQQAQSTRRRWSGDSSALLIAYDRASNSVALSFSPDFWQRYPTTSLVELMRGSGRTITDTKLTLEERLALIIHDLAKRLRQLETVRIQQDRWFQQDEKQFVIVLGALVIGAAMIAAFLGIVSRRRATSSGQQYFFPDVAVGMRLGAAFGGGLIAEVQPQPPAK